MNHNRMKLHEHVSNRSDELQIGDMITSINSLKTFGLKHEEIINLIKTAGDTLILEFEYHLPPWREFYLRFRCKIFLLNCFKI
jgi:hypothetical protein